MALNNEETKWLQENHRRYTLTEVELLIWAARGNDVPVEDVATEYDAVKVDIQNFYRGLR